MSLTRPIFLVGFMGSGKTTVGMALAKVLGRRFIDLDDLIITTDKRSISQIFKENGESYFRQLESKILFSLAGNTEAVIALGGGTFCQTHNRVFVKRSGLSIWLNSSLEDILARMPRDGSRPLLRSREQVVELLAERIPHYQQADIQIDVSHLTVDEIVAKILEILAQIKTAN